MSNRLEGDPSAVVAMYDEDVYSSADWWAISKAVTLDIAEIHRLEALLTQEYRHAANLVKPQPNAGITSRDSTQERTADSKADTPPESRVPRLPDSVDVLDLCRLLQKGVSNGHRAIEIAREFTHENPDSDPKAQSLLRQARRFRHLWRPGDK